MKTHPRQDDVTNPLGTTVLPSASISNLNEGRVLGTPTVAHLNSAQPSPLTPRLSLFPPLNPHSVLSSFNLGSPTGCLQTSSHALNIPKREEKLHGLKNPAINDDHTPNPIGDPSSLDCVSAGITQTFISTADLLQGRPTVSGQKDFPFSITRTCSSCLLASFNAPSKACLETPLVCQLPDAQAITVQGNVAEVQKSANNEEPRPFLIPKVSSPVVVSHDCSNSSQSVAASHGMPKDIGTMVIPSSPTIATPVTKNLASPQVFHLSNESNIFKSFPICYSRRKTAPKASSFKASFLEPLVFNQSGPPSLSSEEIRAFSKKHSKSLFLSSSLPHPLPPWKPYSGSRDFSKLKLNDFHAPLDSDSDSDRDSLISMSKDTDCDHFSLDEEDKKTEIMFGDSLVTLFSDCSTPTTNPSQTVSLLPPAQIPTKFSSLLAASGISMKIISSPA